MPSLDASVVEKLLPRFVLKGIDPLGDAIFAEGKHDEQTVKEKKTHQWKNKVLHIRVEVFGEETTGRFRCRQPRLLLLSELINVKVWIDLLKYVLG